MKYIYPAFFYKEKTGYSVIFPDFGATCGNDLENAYEMAVDYLYNVISGMIEDKQDLPAPSDINKIKPQIDFEYESVFSSLVSIDLKEYEKYLDEKNKAVRKNVTIPKWLSELAEKNHVNFSSVLQEALKKHLEL